MDGAARSILRLVEGSFAIAGLSMGGYVSLAVAAAAPERLRGLMLLNSQARADSEEVRRRRQEQLVVSKDQGLEPILEAQANILMHPSKLPPNIQLGVQTIAEGGPWEEGPFKSFVSGALEVGGPAFAQQQRCIMSRVDTRYVLENLREAGIPLAVLTGSHDAVTPVKVAEEMSSIAGSLCTLTVVEDCGHLSALECPTRVADAIEEWLRRIDSQKGDSNN